jgi:hypothetical protein
MLPKLKPTTTATTSLPISYQQMAQAYARLQAAYPRMNAPINGLGDVDDGVDEHVPGVECVDNPFCEKCHK